MEIPYSGKIKDVSLVKLLMHLHRARKTGTFSLTTSSCTKKMYIQGGDVIFASSSYADDRLGEMLLKAGKITIEQYDRSVEILKTSRNKRQGAILVELGYLTPKELFWGVKFQVKEIIHSMFLIEEGEYAFQEGDPPTQEVITLKMSIGNLIYAGINKIVNWTRIRHEMPHTDSVLRLSDDPLSLFQDIELGQQDKKILSLIDGRRTIKEIIDSSWMGSFEAMKVLYVLWSIGMVEELHKASQKGVAAGRAMPSEETVALHDIFRPASDEESMMFKKADDIFSRLDTMNAMELLEVDRAADNDTIRANYYRLAKEFHPDRYFSSTDPSVKIKLTAIFDALAKAYSSLKDEKRRKEYFASLPDESQGGAGTDIESAGEQFRAGAASLKNGEFMDAIDKLRQATRMAPMNAGYWSYLSLAYSKVPGRIKEAEESLLTALKLEPLNADLHSHLGFIYMKAGLKKQANAAFQKALMIDPDNSKAKKGLEQTQG